MSDQSTAVEGETQDGESTVDPSAAINRGVGLNSEAVAALDPNSPAGQAVAQFKQGIEEYKAAEDAFEAQKKARMEAVYTLKSEHNIGFSAMGEMMGVTSSLALYLYERAQGKSSKQIRAESIASREAKEATRTTDPNRKAPRKQSPEEKALRKQQREALKAFLEDERRKAAERGESAEDVEAGLDEVAEQEALDAEE